MRRAALLLALLAMPLAGCLDLDDGLLAIACGGKTVTQSHSSTAAWEHTTRFGVSGAPDTLHVALLLEAGDRARVLIREPAGAVAWDARLDSETRTLEKDIPQPPEGIWEADMAGEPGQIRVQWRC